MNDYKIFAVSIFFIVEYNNDVRISYDIALTEDILSYSSVNGDSYIMLDILIGIMNNEVDMKTVKDV